MNYKTTAPGGGTPRIVQGADPCANPRSAAMGGRVPVERRDVPSPFNNHLLPFPHAWPFDPTEPKPRPQTWRNRARIAARWIASHAFTWLGHLLALGIGYGGALLLRSWGLY